MRYQSWETSRCTAHRFEADKARTLHCSLPEGHEEPHRDRRAGIEFEACDREWCDKVRVRAAEPEKVIETAFDCAAGQHELIWHRRPNGGRYQKCKRCGAPRPHVAVYDKHNPAKEGSDQ